jgi:nicotinamide-nucleotide amidase
MHAASSHPHARAAIVSVGDELTLGQTLDTNSMWLSRRLTEMGIVPVEHVTVPDNLDAHARVLRDLAARSDLILCSGGLGPTADDLTRAALAQVMGDALVEDPIALAEVEAWFSSRGRHMNMLNRVQAQRPARAVIMPNLHGTAPGLFATLGERGRSCDVFCLPGPPRELMPMFEAQVAPRLRLPEGRTVRTRVLHSFGLGESELAHRLGSLMERGRMPLVGTTASGGVVSIRLRYEGHAPPAEAERALDDTERLVREAAAEYIFGRGEQRLPDVVLALLRSRGEVLGCVESCTGGGLGQLITDVPGSSVSFAGGLVTYSNELKTRLSGVPESLLAEGGPGAVSEETARAMALGGLSALKVQHCLAVTGIAGPDGARPGKPVGTVFVARASGDGEVDVRRFLMVGDRTSVRDWSCKAALAMLWQHLSGLPALKLIRQV